MKRAAKLLFMLNLAFSISAQKPILFIDFENMDEIHTTNGIIGKALDLGDIPNRKALSVKNPLSQNDNFTLTIWVNGDNLAQDSYDILTGVTMMRERGINWKQRIIKGEINVDNGEFNGWKIGMQANGAWEFVARGEKNAYEYKPTPIRQSIRDQNWHLLVISYNSKTTELRFYYDGEQKAIYYAPELQSMLNSDSIVVGNSHDNDYSFHDTDWNTFYGKIDDIAIYNRVLDEDQIASYFEQVTGFILPDQENNSPDIIKVTAFNIWDGGNHMGKEVGRNRIFDIIKREKADIFTLVETYGSGEEIADMLGYYLYLISSNLSIISKYPIETTYPIFNSFNSGGALIKLTNDKKINVFSIWLNYRPTYHEIFHNNHFDMKSFLMEDYKIRGAEIGAILNEIEPLLKQSEEIPIIMGGDFNCGSHLDWIESTKNIHNGYIIPWSVSKMMEEAGFIDAFRKVNLDPKMKVGKTHLGSNDRIDYIYYKGNKLSILDSDLIKEYNVKFPSDHYGVSVLLKINE